LVGNFDQAILYVVLGKLLQPMALIAALVLCSCASTAPGGRAQVTMPTSLSSMYSSVDMNMQLNSAATIADDCTGVQCKVNAGLDKQVQRLGTRLARSAFEAYPDLRERVPAFNFVVAEKSQPGTTSNASGTVVIYRGVHNTRLDEEVLAFLIAREMGHVVARHHDEKSASSMLLSLVAQVFLPVVNVTRGIATLAGSAASIWGSDAVAHDKSAAQANEADQVAFELLARQGWTANDLAESLSAYAQGLRNDAWSSGIKTAATHCATEKLILEIAALPLPTPAAVSPAKDFRLTRSSFARIDSASAAVLPGPKGQLFHQ
jgi:predicted Zn-dependent protease